MSNNNRIKRKKLSVVYTNEAACRDCYRCIRACPVNAISMVNEQAQVIQEKCISCGVCINECPQDAKMYRREIEKVSLYLKQGIPLAFSIAPSFVGIFEEWQYTRLASAIRELGVVYVGETAVGAEIAAQFAADEKRANPGKTLITSACPAVVTYIEKYQREKLPMLSKAVSPMVAHARKIKSDYGNDTRVVFVGPCTAKKMESDREELKGNVDVVLTFDELFELFEANNINLNNCEESSFDEKTTSESRLFPLEGGLLETAHLSTEMLSDTTICLSGIDKLRQFLAMDYKGDYLVEALYCEGGCVNGPVGMKNCNMFTARKQLIDYSKKQDTITEVITDKDMSTNYTSNEAVKKSKFSDNQIKEIFAITGKLDISKQLNCGACGYNSCLDQVNAVLEGSAVTEMCIPYMRRLAEQKNDLILEKDPNGIVICDSKLNIVSMNPAFRKMFSASDMTIGNKISTLMDPDPFEDISMDMEKVIRKDAKYPHYNLICNQTYYAIKESSQVVGIIADITKSYKSQGELKKIKIDTVLQAQDLIDHQISMAQEMAKFLGENTAKGELLMSKLINSIDNKEV